MKPSVSVIVLAWNGQAYLENCLTALLAQDYAPLQIIVVDNGSDDGSVQIAQRFAPRLEVLQNGYNFGFAGGMNIGIRRASGEIVALLNQDTEVQTGWLQALVDAFAEDESVGIVGSKAIYPGSGRLQHAGGVIHTGDAFAYHIGRDEEDHGQYDALMEMDYVSGTAFAIHRRVLETIGELDEGFHPAFYEETDYCYRARRAGFRIVYQPKATLLHHETTSLPQESYAFVSAFHRNRVRFVLRHWTLEELAAFVAAEQEAIAATLSLDDAVARGRAFWRNLVQFSLLMQERRDQPYLGPALDEGEARRLADQLAALEEQAYRRTQILLQNGDAPTPQTGEVAPPDAAQAEPGTPEAVSASEPVQAILQQMAADGRLREYEFVSHAPLIGPLIARFRRMWLSVAARWYVLPVLRQQSRFNAQVVDILQRLAAGEDHERRILRAEAHLRHLDKSVRSQVILTD